MMLNEIKHQKTKPQHYTNETPEFVLEQEQYLERLEYTFLESDFLKGLKSLT